MKKVKKGLILVLIILLGITTACEKKEEKKEWTPKDKTVTTGIFKDYYEKAAKVVNEMTPEEKVGQLFIVKYRAADVEYLSNFYPGGYILFANDFQNHTKETITEELKKDQSLNKYPLLIAVDEEGGYVTRISRYIAYRDKKFKSPREYYEEGGYELVEQTEKEKAELLKSLGINLNLAPVADISTNPDDFIYSRSFGRNAEETSTYIKNMVEYAHENKINACLKHFPGYGNNEDTHTGIAIDERSYENFVENDFKPFEAGIKAGVPSILVSHNVVKAMDSDYPASLSKKVIKELRDTLGFTGVIMTDDLDMDAVKSYVADGKAATLAINAGNDMIMTSDFLGMKSELLESLENGDIREETINNAVTRVIAWKYYSGLMEK